MAEHDIFCIIQLLMPEYILNDSSCVDLDKNMPFHELGKLDKISFNANPFDFIWTRIYIINVWLFYY